MTQVAAQPASSRVIALAASAGGLSALRFVLGSLPADIGAAIVIVQHLDPERRSLMSQILTRETNLQVKLYQATRVLSSPQHLSDGKVPSYAQYARKRKTPWKEKDQAKVQ